MRNLRLVLDYHDHKFRPTRRTLADGLARLDRELDALPQDGAWHIDVPSCPKGNAFLPPDLSFPHIKFVSDDGDDFAVCFPLSRGCWAITSQGERIYLPLAQIKGAVPHTREGAVLLKDGRILRGLEFDTVSLKRDFTDTEDAILFLTVRFLKAENIGIGYTKELPGIWWLNYSRLHELRVTNVKELARYIDDKIAGLSRADPKSPPFGPVSLNKIRDTLSMAHIQKARGRKRKMAA